MKRKGIYALASSLIVVVAMILLITLGVFSNSADKDSTELTSDVPSAPLVAYNSDKPQESITVHGHWTIEVRDPDGSLVESREFDNALATGADQKLVDILGRNGHVGGWSMVLRSSSAENSPWDVQNAYIVEELVYGSPYTATGTDVISDELVLSLPSAQPILVLTASAIASSEGEIIAVYTSFANIDSNLDEYGIPMAFTQTTLETSVNLLAGQHVLVTVEIGFASPSS